MRNGGIYHISVHRLHAPVNHRMVQCVQSAAKIFTDFTRIVFGTAKLSRRCTARYGIDGLCALLYASVCRFCVPAVGSAADFTHCRETLYGAHKQKQFLRMESKTAVQGVRRRPSTKARFLRPQRSYFCHPGKENKIKSLGQAFPDHQQKHDFCVLRDRTFVIQGKKTK